MRETNDAGLTDEDAALAAWLAAWQPHQAHVVLPRPGRRNATAASADAVASEPSLRPVFNLTGSVLHSRLGRAPLPTVAIEAILRAALAPVNLDLDLTTGARIDRDLHVESVLCRLTGAESALVVNNNAAALLLTLNTLGRRKDVLASRGELLEIGDTLRIPDLIARAGCRLREVGTTNRTHLADYEDAIGPRSGLVLNVHTSGYAVRGFTSSVDGRDLAGLCRERGVPLAVDLGSGALVDLQSFGLPHEAMPSETLAAGADLVMFSGDKILGGPQAGVIVGRADLVARLRRNPLARALRIDKLALAALSSVLAVYTEPDRLATRIPVLRMLTRPVSEIQAAVARLQPAVARAVGAAAEVTVTECASDIGAGVLPTFEMPSAGLAIVPVSAVAATPGRRVRARATASALNRVAAAFRALPVPVIGRVHDGAFVLDLRCLEDERGFTEQLSRLDPSAIAA